MKKGIARKQLSSPLFDYKKMFERKSTGKIVAGKPMSYYKVTKRGVLGNFRSYGRRAEYTAEYGYCIVTKEALDAMARILKGKQVIDIGGGAGFITHELRRRKIDITLNDIQASHKEGYYPRNRQFAKVDIVDDINNVDISNYNAFIMSWPCYDEKWTSDILIKMKKGDILILQGEGSGGCTGDDRHHELLSNLFEEREDYTNLFNGVSPRWYGIRDSWRVFQAN